MSLAAVGVTVGCAPVRRSASAPFLPPAELAEKFVTPDPPRLDTAASVERDLGRSVALPLPASVRPGKDEAIIRDAEWHFQAGRKQYQDGDAAGARREFDRAIEALLSAPDVPTPGSRGAVERKLEELVEAIHRLELEGLGSADTDQPPYDKAPLDDIPEMTFRVDPKLKDKVLEEVRATTSQLPIEVNDAVLSYIDYFSTERGRKVLLTGLRHGGRYRPLIQRILDEEGVPQELMFVAQAESGFLPRAVSRKKAMGMWQFVRARARQYGLAQTAYTDERLDFEKATRAAARHLRDLYQRYGDWYLALGAYNAGPGVIDRAVERTGYADFWEFRRRKVLPRETANYVPIILSMMIMVKNAREHGLEDVELDPPIEYDVAELDAPANLALIGDLIESPVSEIRALNPALLKNIAPAGKLRVPKGAVAQLAMLDLVPAGKRLSWRAHRMADGETLASVARRYRVAQKSVLAANAGVRDSGDVLLIPVSAQKTARSASRGRRTASRSSPVKRASAQTPAARSRSAAAPVSKRGAEYSAANARSGSKIVRR